MDRVAFLARLSRSLAHAQLPPDAAQARDAEVATTSGRGEILRLFLDRAHESGAVPCVVPTIQAAQEAVEKLVARRAWTRVVCRSSMVWPGIGSIHSSDARSADLGLATADWAVAETGSVAVESSPEADRSSSLLPAATGFFVSLESILETTGDALRKQLAREPRAIPSCTCLVTGPSSTGDLAAQHVVGAHGPVEVFIWVIEGSADAAPAAETSRADD